MRPVIYQLFVRHFSNMETHGVDWGTRETNGCGTFNGVTDKALREIARMKSIISNKIHWNLSCKTYQWHAVVVGCGNSRYKVCRTRTTCY